MGKSWDVLINQMDERYKAGEKIYIQLQNIRPDNMDILIALAHLGDTLWVAVYAEAYCKQNNCGGIIVCIEIVRLDITDSKCIMGRKRIISPKF